jgi:hypothetical protein
MNVQKYRQDRWIQRSALVLVLAMASLSFSAWADIVNEGFETGDLSGWGTVGDVSTEDGSFGATPTEGAFDALLTNIGVNDMDGHFNPIDPFSGNDSVDVASIEAAFGLGANAIDGLGNGNLAQSEGSGLFQTVTVNAGDQLTFDWNFLTNEFTPEINYNDFAFLAAGDSLIELSDLSGTFVASGTPFLQETGWSSFSHTFGSSGSFTVGFGMVDVGDDLVTSGLLVDNLNIQSASKVVPEPATWAMLTIGLGGLAARRARGRRADPAKP